MLCVVYCSCMSTASLFFFDEVPVLFFSNVKTCYVTLYCIMLCYSVLCCLVRLIIAAVNETLLLWSVMVPISRTRLSYYLCTTAVHLWGCSAMPQFGNRL